VFQAKIFHPCISLSQFPNVLSSVIKTLGASHLNMAMVVGQNKEKLLIARSRVAQIGGEKLVMAKHTG
jgi:hypothetical protein